jgi:hypothetical protein
MAASAMLDQREGCQEVDECPWDDAPEAVRYLFKTDIFYTFAIIVNLEESKVIGEKCVFDTFDGCTMMAPEEGNSYNLEVPPGCKRIVAIRNSLSGFGYGYSYNRRVIMDDG